MGLATDVSSAVLGNALSSDEMRKRSEEERSFASPEATADGQVRRASRAAGGVREGAGSRLGVRASR